MIFTLLSFILVIGIIVTLHELGHFLAARATGMRVNKFSIGFPPKIWSRKIGDTEYQLCWIPLGGFVQIAGMVDESLDETGITGAPDEFMSKNAAQKIFVLAAGVLMNYITAFVLLTVLTLTVGLAELDGSRIGKVVENMPALAAGVQEGDEIRAVNGAATSSWDDVVKQITSAADTVHLTVFRSARNESLELFVPTEWSDSSASRRRVIGIAPAMVFRSASPFEAIRQGYNFCLATTVGIVDFLSGLVGGTSSVKDLSGPIGVAKLSGESARAGSDAFILFLAYVSVSIGFLNILPFPVLDGGHIVYVIIESIIRRPISSKVKLHIQQAGVVMLLLLVLFVSYHDILRIFAN